MRLKSPLPGRGEFSLEVMASASPDVPCAVSVGVGLKSPLPEWMVLTLDRGVATAMDVESAGRWMGSPSRIRRLIAGRNALRIIRELL